MVLHTRTAHTGGRETPHLQPQPCGNVLQAPSRQQLLPHKAVHAGPVGHPQRHQAAALLQQTIGRTSRSSSSSNSAGVAM